jgi:hypothetical protein
MNRLGFEMDSSSSGSLQSSLCKVQDVDLRKVSVSRIVLNQCMC